MKIKEFFDPTTSTLTYVVWDENTRDGLIIDPVWDYDQGASKVSSTSAENVLAFVKSNGVKPHYILETHAHADHLSASKVLKKKLPLAKIAIGSRIIEVQKIFKDIFHLQNWFHPDGSQFDQLFEEHDVIQAGSLQLKVLYTPGHTPACASYLINDAVFSGDVIFMPDYGTGRCDFPAGSAETMYESIAKKLYALPDKTRIFVGHDYQPGGRPMQFETSIAEQRKSNIHLKDGTTKELFVKFRTERDKTLAAPKLLLPSIQVNINGGDLPPADSNGFSYLRIPVNAI